MELITNIFIISTMVICTLAAIISICMVIFEFIRDRADRQYRRQAHKRKKIHRGKAAEKRRERGQIK